MTGQVVNQATEVLLPYLQSLYTSHTLKKKLSKQGIVNEDDDSETIEQKIRKRVVKALSLPEYNLYYDYAELGNQFALIVMFSIVWPLAGVCFLVNNWMEVRTDAFKICRAVRRPIPREGRGIGPWFGIFWVVSVVGAVCTGWIVGVYGGEVNLEGAASERTLERIPRALVGVFVAEHFHIVAWWLIEFGFGVVFGSGVERELELHNSRRRTLQETIEQVHKEEDGEEDIDERVERVMELVSSVF
ncbi:hypothetical protein HDU99_006795 [Rhizoclosmatium hyalinum]|nr:hypothetical protein HDU99_006795 [Rhizoclosmatium hyalinum]